MRVHCLPFALLVVTSTLLGGADAYHTRIPGTRLRPKGLPRAPAKLAVIPPPINPVTFKWPIVVTGAWLGMYYKYMCLGPTARLAGTSEAHTFSCERCFGNLHEQSVPFLASLWLHAAFVSPADAAILGAAWLVLRALYAPLRILGDSKAINPKMLALSTLPGYAVIIYMGVSAVLLPCFSFDLRAALLGSHVLGTIACFFGFFAYFSGLMKFQKRFFSQK